MFRNGIIVLASLLCLQACSSDSKQSAVTEPAAPVEPAPPEKTLRPDFKIYFDSFNVQGSFSLLDVSTNNYILYNDAQFDQGFLPASTFKICNSMIALETGAIEDEHKILKWDGVKRSIPDWNADQNMIQAYKHSTVWFYQELARRIGPVKMKQWLDTLHYGNADISGAIDSFWLNGGLRISPHEQITFLERIQNNSLPFSERTKSIIKRIMIEEQTDSFTLRAKTGWAVTAKMDIGWYVGYVEKGKKAYVFATCIQNKNPENKQFAECRRRISKNILHALHIL